MRDRFVFIVETDHGACEGVFAKPGGAVQFAREQYEMSFPRGTVSRLKNGEVIIQTPPWDESGECMVTLSRRRVQ